MAQALVTAQDYRGFLAEAFRLQKLTHPNFSLASFARKAEFASRSYARDVIQGQKRITASSLPKFIKGLGLRGALKDAFIYLVGLSEPDAVMDLPPPGADATGTGSSEGTHAGTRLTAGGKTSG